MNGIWHNLLAQDRPDSPWGSLSWLLVVLLLMFFSWVGKKIKERHDVAEAEREHREAQQGAARPAQAQRPAPPREPTPAEQAVIALREILGGGQPPVTPPAPEPPPMQAVQTPRPAPAPPRRVLPPIGKQRPRGRLAPAAGQVLGGGVEGEVDRGRRHLTAEEAELQRRLKVMGHLRTNIAGAEADQTHPRTLLVDLSERTEAARGIVYAEILGPPKALRRGQEMWDV